MSNTRKAGRRERFLARRRPSAPYSIAVDDDTDAVNELAAAKEALDIAQLRTDDQAGQAVTDAEKRLEKARKTVAACYETVTLTAMAPADFEALIAEHPAREGEDEKWDDETFPRACFLACIDDDALTPEEWGAFVDECMSQGEREYLFRLAIALNARWPSGAVPNV
jgi:hypothetical protein